MTEDEIRDTMRASIVKAYETHFGFTPKPQSVDRLLKMSEEWAHDAIRKTAADLREMERFAAKATRPPPE